MTKHGMWSEYDERAFGYTRGQWKEWKRQWLAAGAYLGDNRGSMPEEQRAEWLRKQDEVVERARANKNRRPYTDSEVLHDRFYGVINESKDVLTDELEAEVEKFNAWLGSVEDVSEVTGV